VFDALELMGAQYYELLADRTTLLLQLLFEHITTDTNR
jgi:hypothetical protein